MGIDCFDFSANSVSSAFKNLNHREHREKIETSICLIFSASSVISVVKNSKPRDKIAAGRAFDGPWIMSV